MLPSNIDREGKVRPFETFTSPFVCVLTQDEGRALPR